jgi:hypothetical protein
MSHWREVLLGETTHSERLEVITTWRRFGGSRINMGKLSEAARSLENAIRLLDTLSETPSEAAGRQEHVILLFELSRLNARAGDWRGSVENAKEAVTKQEALSSKAANRGASAADSYEVSIQDGTNQWTKSFRTASVAMNQYAASAFTGEGDGSVRFLFEAKFAGGNNPRDGVSSEIVQPGSSVEPSPCVKNVVGVYRWTTDNRSTSLGNGLLEEVGFVKLTADHVAVTQNGTPLRDGRPGVWKITNDCLVTINWQNGRYIDILTLSNDGKKLTGTSQIGTIITGSK